MGKTGIALGLCGLIITGCAGIRGSTGPIAAPDASPSPVPIERAPFVPPTKQIGEVTRLALTFPDGTKAWIGYPSHLELAEMGVQPDVDLTWDGRWVGAIVFSRQGRVDELLERRIAVHASDPPIEEWTARSRPGRHQSTTGWLVYRLPSWAVHVPLDPRTDPRNVIDRVRPYQTPAGFVAVDDAHPAVLAEGYGEAGGPQLAFGDSAVLPDFVRPDPSGLLIAVAPSDCRRFRPPVQLHGAYASACLDERMFVNGTSFSDTEGSQRTLAQVVEGIQLLEFEPAP
jgi:hypothetical protein